MVQPVCLKEPHILEGWLQQGKIKKGPRRSIVTWAGHEKLIKK